jgi:hypothetical protein
MRFVEREKKIKEIKKIFIYFIFLLFKKLINNLMIKIKFKNQN